MKEEGLRGDGGGGGTDNAGGALRRKKEVMWGRGRMSREGWGGAEAGRQWR